MAWLGTAVSLGVVVGPALGGLLSRRDWHFNWSAGHFKVDSFLDSVFRGGVVRTADAVCGIALAAGIDAENFGAEYEPGKRYDERKSKADWRTLVKTLSPLLALTLAGQFALTIFEGTFALFAQAKFNFGPAEVGYVFVVCGLVMTVFQAGAVGFLAGKSAR